MVATLSTSSQNSSEVIMSTKPGYESINSDGLNPIENPVENTVGSLSLKKGSAGYMTLKSNINKPSNNEKKLLFTTIKSISSISEDSTLTDSDRSKSFRISGNSTINNNKSLSNSFGDTLHLNGYNNKTFKSYGVPKYNGIHNNSSPSMSEIRYVPTYIHFNRA